jgi:hypothetical protein
MITQQQVLDAFEYREGKLYWKYVKSIAIKVGDEAGANDGYGYRVIRFSNKLYRAHHLVYLMFNGVLPKRIDHINGNRLDNRIENLRIATDSQNNCNKGLQSNNTTGYKNVKWHERIKKYEVSVQFNKQRKYIGVFEDLELADLVAHMAREKYHGAFAKHI